MKTSQEWVQDLATDTEKVKNWLQRQYRGEVRASIKIGHLASISGTGLESVVLGKIARDESKHARWIKDLYVSLYDESPNSDQENASNRYWAAQEDQDFTPDELYALGAHAEAMRLERIEAVIDCAALAPIIRDVFKNIRKDEVFHADAFAAMASTSAMDRMEPLHQEGLKALGLVL